MIIPYLIKSTLCLAVLFGFYKVALESKALHQFKRYYLLASLVFSLTIPLVTFTYTTAAVPQDIWIENFVVVQDQNTAPITPVIIEEKTNYLPYVLWSIYGIGILIFGGRFAGNLVRLKRKITTAQTHQQKDFTLALLQQTIVPHSFLKYIFLSRKRYENKEIPPEVIAHEATHVRQKHSLDILFIEFLQVIFWFNPLFWITKKSITLNHEFLADQGAVQEQHDIYQYQNILLSYASSTHHTTLESPFNYSSTKKRILMLSQSFNRKRLAISALLLIPIIAGCVLVFNQGIIAQPVDKAHEENTDPTLYARSIDINILDNASLEVDGIKTSKKNLQKTLESLHTDITKEQRDRVINIHVSSEDNISYQDLVFIQGIATKYGYHRIVTPKEEIVRAKGNVPAADHNSSVVKEAFEAMHQQTSNNYATEFVEGAERNGEKALVIEIRNNTVRVNGKASSVATLRSDIDAITRDWSQEAYREAFPSVLVKNPDKGFIKKLNEEFLKTNFSKANGGMDLLPPPPPPPAPPAPSQVPPPPPPPSVEDHLKSMNEIGGIFYYENKEVTFDKALNLVKTNKNLNVQTRSPYTNAPKTYISIEPIVVPTQKENTDPVTKKDIAVYNKLAKKYNKNPNGQILKKEVAFMYDIYNRMTEKQKKNAESYPAIPPPPPPAPKSPKAPKKVGGNQLASAQKILGIQTIQEQTKVHLDKGGVFILNGKTASKKEVLDFYTSETTETSRVRVDKKVKPAVMYVDNIPKEMAYTPITEKEIKEYNTLAKKYRNNPNGEIKKKELRTLYHVYVNMSEKQKADAEPYPAIAPPPAQNKKIGALLDAPKNIKTRKEQVVKHAQQGGTFVLNTETSTVEEVLNYIRVAKGTKLRVDKNSNPSILYIDSTPPAGSYAAITEEEVQKYNALAKKYTDNPNQKVKTKDRRRLYHVYVHMTRSQRMVAEPYPVLPPDKTSKNGLVGVRGLSLEDRNSFNTSILDPSQKTIQEDARYYYNHRHISTAEAKELIANTPNIKQRTKPSKTFGQPVIFLYTSDLFEPAPRPTAANIIAHIKVSNRHQSQFYYGSEKITYEEALKLVRKDRSLEVITTINEQEQYQTKISKA